MADDNKFDKVLDLLTGLAKRMDALESGAKARKDAFNPGDVKAAQNEVERQKGYVKTLESSSSGDLQSNIVEARRMREHLRNMESSISLAMQEQGDITSADEAKMSQFQSRADSVYSAHGRQAPGPLPGEQPRAYRARLMMGLREYHPDLKHSNFSGLPMDVLGAYERVIHDAAMQEACSPTNVPEGEMRAVKKKDAAGRDIVEFYGKSTFVKQFAAPFRRVVNIADPKSVMLQQLMSQKGPLN